MRLTNNSAALNPSVQGFSDNLDALQAKLDKILATIKQINAGFSSSGGGGMGGGGGAGATAFSSMSVSGSGSFSISMNSGAAAFAAGGTGSPGGGGGAPIGGIGWGGGAALGFAANGIAGTLSNMAQTIATGNYDPMAGIRQWGGLLGGTIGGTVGILGGATGVATGMMAGSQLGSAGAEFAAAPLVAQRNAQMTLAGVAERQNINVGDLAGDMRGGVQYSGPTGLHPFGSMSTLLTANTGGVLKTMAETITRSGKNAANLMAIDAGIYTGTDIMTLSGITDIYATLSSAALAGGDRSNMVGETGRLASLGLPGIARARAATPAFAVKDQFGYNPADILFAVGEESYGAFQDAIGGSDLTPSQARGYSGARRADVRASKAGLAARGSGRAAGGFLYEEMNDIAAIPGGSESVAYARVAAQYRAAGSLAFQQESYTNYGIPAVQLQGEMDRQQVLPFSGTQNYNLAGRNIQLQSGRIQDIGDFMARRRQAGMLSEQEEFDLTRQMEAAHTSLATSQATLSEGMENRLPTLTAGRPGSASFGRYNSMQLSALAYAYSGSPVRGGGAWDDAQRRHQNAVFDDYGMSGGTTSRTSGLNNGTDRIVALLERLVALNERGGSGSGKRPGEALGNLQGAISQNKFEDYH